MEMNYKKVLFKDGNQDKVALGNVEFEKDFVKVTDGSNKTIYINNSHVVFVKDIARD